MHSLSSSFFPQSSLIFVDPNLLSSIFWNEYLLVISNQHQWLLPFTQFFDYRFQILIPFPHFWFECYHTGKEYILTIFLHIRTLFSFFFSYIMCFVFQLRGTKTAWALAMTKKKPHITWMYPPWRHGKSHQPKSLWSGTNRTPAT